MACASGPCLGLGQGTSQTAKGQRLMAISLKPWPKILDIRGCAWGKPVGSRRPGNPRLRDAKLMLTITITITIMGLSHYPRHGHGLELWPCLGLAQGKIQRPTANGHSPRHGPRYGSFPFVSQPHGSESDYQNVEFLTFINPEHVIYDIGTEILMFHCFATKMLKSFCKSIIFSGIESSRRDLAF